ncbi:hypothetical protein KSB_93480 [Ktedonobacter robiniae]|uniref:Uncharacterized protein n=1 Tax=Ktedonobacter robiniae TaxID=2778365 RepID=A0ABQ3V7H2_9CHLR|nr:hypothetical protein KSB_93480 [Ktedonobacter robiniae]
MINTRDIRAEYVISAIAIFQAFQERPAKDCFERLLEKQGKQWNAAHVCENQEKISSGMGIFPGSILVRQCIQESSIDSVFITSLLNNTERDNYDR